MKFIKVNGKIRTLLSLHGGIANIGMPMDVNNDNITNGNIWEMGDFDLHLSKFNLKVLWYRCYRFFKTDVFGRSGFNIFLNKFNIV